MKRFHKHPGLRNSFEISIFMFLVFFSVTVQRCVVFADWWWTRHWLLRRGRHKRTNHSEARPREWRHNRLPFARRREWRIATSASIEQTRSRTRQSQLARTCLRGSQLPTGNTRHAGAGRSCGSRKCDGCRRSSAVQPDALFFRRRRPRSRLRHDRLRYWRYLAQEICSAWSSIHWNLLREFTKINITYI